MPKQAFRLSTCCKIRGFGVSRKGIENEKQNGFLNNPQIEFWAFRGFVVEFLGSGLRGLIFDDFDWQENRQLIEKSRRRREKIVPPWGGRRQRWGPAEAFGVSKSMQKGSVRLMPPTP